MDQPEQDVSRTGAAAVVMAAGKGTRMKSPLPKVLVPALGRPMIEYVLDALSAGGVERILVVVGYEADMVRRQLADRPGVEFVLQAEQLGTGHAVMVCRDALADHAGPVLVVAGDSPMLRPESVHTVLAEQRRLGAACLMGTAHKANPQGMGRIVRGADGRFQAIVEERDADPAQKQITEVNLSVYAFASPELFQALDRVDRKNAQGEYYLTDAPGVLLAQGKLVEALPVLTESETLSVNDPDELAQVERAMRHE